jgi:hypothetical protein
MRHVKKSVVSGVALAVILALTAASCSDDGESDSRKEEKAVKTAGHEQLVKKQPAEAMTYSPTRATINFWMKTWEKPNKLSYVYLQNADGKVIGYYVLKGLPVSYCAMLTPPEEIIDRGSSGRIGMMAQAPSMDGVYYADGGTLCSTYYGQDATTGSYLEYTVGMGQNVLLYEQPMDHPSFQEAVPLGGTDLDRDKPES